MFFFFFNDTATTEIYTLSLHDALPICTSPHRPGSPAPPDHPACTHELLTHRRRATHGRTHSSRDRKSTRLNSSHANISYAVFCLKKKKTQKSIKSCTTNTNTTHHTTRT